MPQTRRKSVYCAPNSAPSVDRQLFFGEFSDDFDRLLDTQIVGNNFFSDDFGIEGTEAAVYLTRPPRPLALKSRPKPTAGFRV